MGFRVERSSSHRMGNFTLNVCGLINFSFVGEVFRIATYASTDLSKHDSIIHITTITCMANISLSQVPQ